jgi:hypothetical protein
MIYKSSFSRCRNNFDQTWLSTLGRTLIQRPMLLVDFVHNLRTYAWARRPIYLKIASSLVLAQLGEIWALKLWIFGPKKIEIGSRKEQQLGL